LRDFIGAIMLIVLSVLLFGGCGKKQQAVELPPPVVPSQAIQKKIQI
jgi:uncharacterized lipoprotein YajG